MVEAVILNGLCAVINSIGPGIDGDRCLFDNVLGNDGQGLRNLRPIANNGVGQELVGGLLIVLTGGAL